MPNALMHLVLSIKRSAGRRIDHAAASLRARKLLMKGCKIGDRTYIGPRSIIWGTDIQIGRNSTIVSDANISGNVKIGDNVIIAAMCKIMTRNHDYFQGDALPYGTGYAIKPVVIEDNVWIGENVIIVPGVRLGEGCVVGVGAVVTKDVPACAVVGGNPAKVIKYRDVAWYEKLKAEKKYLNDIRGRVPVSKRQKRDAFIEIDRLLQQSDTITEMKSPIIPGFTGYVYYEYVQAHPEFRFGLNDEGYYLARNKSIG